jgi:two-component system sensor histidine kinase and response regulator WspE
MFELFRTEIESQSALLTAGLLELERNPDQVQRFEALMRAAHSLKGAARIANLQTAVRVAHALEDCFVLAQRRQLVLKHGRIDSLLRGVDLLANLSRRSETELNSWDADYAAEIREFLNLVSPLISSTREPVSGSSQEPCADLRPEQPKPDQSPRPLNAPTSEQGGQSGQALLASDAVPSSALENTVESIALHKADPAERVLRLGAENLNRLLALAGEALVESRWLRPFADSLQQFKRSHADLSRQIDHLRRSLSYAVLSERTQTCFAELVQHVTNTQQFLTERIQELDKFDRRSAHLSQRLYLEVLRTRMRPFGEGVRRFPRMVRDLARALGKEVRLDIYGEETQVDRDILERLETPLAHLLRNAVDHGCEPPEVRRRAGKPAECGLRLEARHSAGVLLVIVSDDGGGVDVESVRKSIVRKGLVSFATAAKLSESELLEFLFLPGFTLRDTVTEISGRGFGLDVVKNMIKGVRGSIRLNNQLGRGLRVQLQLPLTLSVLRALLVNIAGEPYAIPLSQIHRTLKVPRTNIQTVEGRRTFRFGDEQIGLISAQQVLGCGLENATPDDLCVAVLGDRSIRYGVIVEQFLGERELVVQPLDPRLGKVQDISAAALMEDGSPVLIIDVEELLRSIETRSALDSSLAPATSKLLPPEPRPKRVLAVDDSLSIRELERKLLTSRGYLADVAGDGLEAWNAVRSGHYDLVITDIDMPHLDGIGLANRMKNDARLRNIPLLIVSYKEGEDERLRSLEAGADFYLAKGSFHDQTLLQAVVDLIGEPVT